MGNLFSVGARLFVESSLDVPSISNSSPETGCANPNILGPISQNHGSSIVRESDVASPITALLSTSTPFAIPRFVVSVIVDSIKAFSSWSLTHIGEEQTEPTPSSTYFNPSGSVPFVLGRAFPKAPSSHGKPGNVGSSPTLTNSFPVFFHGSFSNPSVFGSQGAFR